MYFSNSSGRQNWVGSLHKVCLIIGCILTCQQVLARPLIDDGAAYFELETSRSSATTVILLKDDMDPDRFYYPYDRLKIMRDDSGIWDFSFAYSQRGALIGFTVIPTTDTEQLAAIQAKIRQTRPNALFFPLPISSGTYSLSLKMPTGERGLEVDAAMAADSSANPWSAQIALSKDIADMVVAALQTGAVFGANYTYQYTAAIQPSVVRVSINTKRVVRQLELNPFHTTASLATLMRTFSQERIITIESIGAEAPLDLAIVAATRWMQERCLRGLPGTLGTVAFTGDTEACRQNLQSTIEIRTSGTFEATATAGMSLWSLCDTHPEYYSFRDRNNNVVTGCPDALLPNLGEKTNTWPKRLPKYRQDPSLPYPTPILAIDTTEISMP